MLRRALACLLLPALPLLNGGLAAAASPASARYEDETPAAIALFSRADFGGEVREAFDPFSTLKEAGFNDTARSVAVLAGQWELCENREFQGRCVFIREDVADLGWYGLDRRVTSVRPIFEYTEAEHGLMFTRDGYGNIRYAHDEVYGSDSYTYGYASSSRLTVYHYGYSPLYSRYGYYSPSWGYDPYGFAYGRRGHYKYAGRSYRSHPRPVTHPVNDYWSGRDWRDHRRDDWKSHRRDDRKDDWRNDRRETGDDDRRTGRRREAVSDPLPRTPGPGAGRRDDVAIDSGTHFPAVQDPAPDRRRDRRGADPAIAADSFPSISDVEPEAPRRRERSRGDDGLAGGPIAAPGGSDRRGRTRDDRRSGGDFTAPPPPAPIEVYQPAQVYEPAPSYDPAPSFTAAPSYEPAQVFEPAPAYEPPPQVEARSDIDDGSSDGHNGRRRERD